MHISIRGYSFNSGASVFDIIAYNTDDTFAKRVEVTESEAWEVIGYLMQHPHYMVTRYGIGQGIIGSMLCFECVYAPTLKAKQIAEINKQFMRCYASCDELDWNQDIVVESDPDHSLDFLHSDVDLYVKQIGLEGHADWVVLKIRGHFQDGLAYDGYFIGTQFSECVENLDKAKAGQPFGKPLEDWEK